MGTSFPTGNKMLSSFFGNSKQRASASKSISRNAGSDCSVATSKIAMDAEMVSLVQREKVRQYFMMCSLSFRQLIFCTVSIRSYL